MRVRLPYRSSSGVPNGIASLRGAVALGVAGKSAEMVTLLLLATLVPRALGAQDFGRFSIALTVVTLCSLALTLGGPPLMTRFVPAAAACDRVALSRALARRLARSRAAILATAVSVAALAVAIAPDAVPLWPTAVVAAALTASVGTTIVLLMVLGLGHVGAWSARYPLQNAILVAATLGLHALAGFDGALLAILVSCLVTLGAAVLAARPVAFAAAGPEPPIPPGAVRFGVMHGAGAALLQITQRGGVLAVALIAGSSVAAGDAALAIGIALGATYAVLQLFTVALPRVVADGRVEVAERRLGHLAGWMLAVLLPTCAVFALALDRLVPAMFGAGFDGAVPAFGPALAIVVLAPLGAFVVQVASLRFRPEVALVSGAAALAAFVVVAVAAIPGLGAAGGTGAALAGVATAGVAGIHLLPGSVGPRLATASFGGAALVLLFAAAG